MFLSLLALVLLAPLARADRPARPSERAARSEIEAFNRALSDVTLRMDNAGLLALWEDEGVSLLPGQEPIVGKKALANFLVDVVAKMPGAKVTKEEMQCFDIEASGAWASEWCRVHQEVRLAPDKPPIESFGKMLLVLHQGKDGKWRLTREMWNRGVVPESAADSRAGAAIRK